MDPSTLKAFLVLSILQLCMDRGVTQEAHVEYIVTVKNGEPFSAQAVSIKSQLRTHFSAAVHKEIAVGNLRFLLTTTTAENSLKIAETVTGVLNVSPNVKVKASLPSRNVRDSTVDTATDTALDTDLNKALLSHNTEESNTLGTEGNNNEPDLFTADHNTTWNSTEESTTHAGTEANTESSTEGSVDICSEQQSGDYLWGLTRMVRRGDTWNPGENRTTKDPVDGVYTYSSNDDGQGVEIYVVDSGVMTDHKDFKGRAKSAYTAEDLRSEGSGDLSGHGTHVAGSAGASTYGVAKRATLKSVKVLNGKGVGAASWIIEGLEYIYDSYLSVRSRGKRPRWVVNMSLGASVSIPPLDDALKQMIQAGIIVVVAAGNEAEDACNGSPASVAEAIVVGATDDQDRLTDFSNYGTCVDILAPGARIRSTYIPTSTSVIDLDGTSMASPYVAGIVARYIQDMDEAPLPAEVEAWLTSTATAGVINVNIGKSHAAITTDKLVFKECTPGPEYLPEEEEEEPEEDWLKYLYYALGGAGLVTVMSVGGTMKCMSENKSVLGFGSKIVEKTPTEHKGH